MAEEREGSGGGGIPIPMTLSVPGSVAQAANFNIAVNQNGSANTAGTVSGSNGAFNNLPSSVTAGATYNNVQITQFNGTDQNGAFATVTLTQNGCPNRVYNIYQST